MRLFDVMKLTPGLYRLHWTGDPGRPSLAAVGATDDGRRWYAPADWEGGEHPPEVASEDWEGVERAELLVWGGDPPRPPADPDLVALTTRLNADPRDPATLLALADWVEERGGEADPLREIVLGERDVVVIGIDDDMTEDDVVRVQEKLSALSGRLREAGRDVEFLLLPASWTVRQIRTRGRGGV